MELLDYVQSTLLFESWEIEQKSNSNKYNLIFCLATGLNPRSLIFQHVSRRVEASWVPSMSKFCIALYLDKASAAYAVLLPDSVQ